MFEREFYPLSEVANRLGCAISDLLHLGIQCRAQICVNIYGMADGFRKTRMSVDPEEQRPDHVMPVGIFMLSPEDIRFIEMPDGLPFKLFEATQFDESWTSGNKSWCNVEFDPPATINLGHLVVLNPEADRLDALQPSLKNDNATETRGQKFQDDPWTDEEIVEMREYREENSAQKTGAKFGISRQRVDTLLKTKTQNSTPSANDPFGMSSRKK